MYKSIDRTAVIHTLNVPNQKQSTQFPVTYISILGINQTNKLLYFVSSQVVHK